MITNAETAALLRRAAAHVRETGLNKTMYWPDDWITENVPSAPACSVGHLMVEAGVWRNSFGFQNPHVRAAILAMAEVLDPHVREFDAFKLLTDWNDAPERTADEVAVLMEAAAISLLESDLAVL